MKFITKIYVTIFGIGFFPVASGTVSSVVTILIWLFIVNFYSIFYFYLLFLVIFISSFFFVKLYLKYQKKADPSEVVVDEFLGQSIPLLFILEIILIEIIIAFAVFRLFDIYKIFPVDKAENMPGSLGVILDDIVAGIYALIFVIMYRILIGI